MDKELIAYLDERFRESLGEIQSFREETFRKFEQIDSRLDRVETAVRHTQIEVEALRGDVRLLAEAMTGDQRLETFKDQVAQEFHDVRQLIRPVYSALDHRIRSLEVWRECKERDPMDVVRERFGLGGR